MRFTCPCCGYKTLAEGQISCGLCQWKDDPYQSMDPDFEGGLNASSLRAAQYQFKQRNMSVNGYKKDPNWCAFAMPVLQPNQVLMPIKYFAQ